MKRSETQLLLTKISTVDNRRLDPPGGDPANPLSMPILSEWHELIGDLNFADCLEAVRMHRRSSTEWLQPKHVLDGVRAIRSDRIERGPGMAELMADVDENITGREWARIYRERLTQVADGAVELRALPGGAA